MDFWQECSKKNLNLVITGQIADKIIVATALILLVMDGTIRNYEVIAAIIILLNINFWFKGTLKGRFNFLFQVCKS